MSEFASIDGRHFIDGSLVVVSRDAPHERFAAGFLLVTAEEYEEVANRNQDMIDALGWSVSVIPRRAG